MLSSIRKLRFVSKEKTIEVDVINAKDQDAAKIEFYYDKVENVCLHLAENPVEAKQVMNQLPTLVKRLLDQFRDMIA